MLGLRPFKPTDADKIASWLQERNVYRMWGGGLIGAFPLSGDDIRKVYIEDNGLCEEEDNFYPLTACDEEGTVGHLILRYLNGDRKYIRFGWVIVDDSKRGKGYGKEMILKAQQYAFEIMNADKVCLGVFENNSAAYHCYKAAGFRPSTDREDSYTDVDGEKWKVIELEITREEYEAGL